MVSTEADHIKYFRFLNFWVDNPNFMLTVKNCWDRQVEGNAMWKFHQKMKRLAITLSGWSRNEFGDIFQKVRMYEEQVHEAEEKYILDQIDSNRSTLHELNAQYIKFLKLEDNILKQKTQLQWFKDGENNIGQEACEHFKKIFIGENKYINEHNLECIPSMVNHNQNTQLTKLPNIKGLKEVVFSMNTNSAAGPDGMNGYFFQKCWNIIKEYLMEVLHALFNGKIIPKYFSHSCIVLLPKVNNPNKFTEFRPISLSNFTSKIISKLVSKRLSRILPSLISNNQSGFVKGRIINENIMLAQEIIHQIKKPNIGSNVIIKLDMAKAYDWVSWSYICLVLRKMGFNEVFIDMIWRIMANNWYIVIVNGWQTKQLSYGGKAVLSKHVLQALPIHLLSAVTPPNTLIKQIQMLIADFFCGWKNNKKKYHWSSWKNLSYPYEEGGIGMRNLQDVCKSFQFKQWWIFINKQTLWGDFLKDKYCQRSNPVSEKWDTGESLNWKHMLATRQQMEQHIQWRLQARNCSFLWDNWLGIGPLAHHTSSSNKLNYITVAAF
nr:uncharacterized protein LOC101264798 [Solanum lycopersicum]